MPASSLTLTAATENKRTRPHAPLPPRLSLEQVRRLAKDLLRDLKDGNRAAIRRLAVVSAPSTLAGAQLAIAREYGFPSWARLKRDVELREILDSLDVGRLRALVAEEPDLASTTMEHWVDHPAGASPLGYVAMLRYHTTRGICTPSRRLSIAYGPDVDHFDAAAATAAFRRRLKRMRDEGITEAHVFLAGPAPLALLLGASVNAGPALTLYHTVDGEYVRSVRLTE